MEHIFARILGKQIQIDISSWINCVPFSELVNPVLLTKKSLLFCVSLMPAKYRRNIEKRLKYCLNLVEIGAFIYYQSASNIFAKICSVVF